MSIFFNAVLRGAAMAAAAFGVVCLPVLGQADDESAFFEIEGNVAYLSGELGEAIDAKVARLLRDVPDLEWIVTSFVPGSDTDENLLAGRRIRQADIATYIPADGMIASGGTDFFLAGAERIVEQGACIGVHSWADDSETRQPKDIPRGDEAHRVYLDYYRDIGIDEAFYWYTLSAAPAEKIHWMSDAEIRKYGVATEILATQGDMRRRLPACEDR